MRTKYEAESASANKRVDSEIFEGQVDFYESIGVFKKKCMQDTSEEYQF